MIRDQLGAALSTALPRCRVAIRVLFDPIRYGVWAVLPGRHAVQAVIDQERLGAGIKAAAASLAMDIAEAAPDLVAL